MVIKELVRHTEPLEPDELAFLERKESKDRSLYFFVFRVLMALSFIIPFAGAWYRAVDGLENAFSPLKYFATTGFLLTLSSACTYATYRMNLRRVQLDIAGKTKTVELSRITRKVYFPSKDAYYFYIDSQIKLSIEVSADDFMRMGEGDELSIEYTTHSRQYLGYF